MLDVVLRWGGRTALDGALCVHGVMYDALDVIANVVG